LTILEYYFLPYFVVALLWLIASAAIIVITVIELVKLIGSRKLLSGMGVIKILTFCFLTYLTIMPWITRGIIEQIDWKISYNKRLEVVNQVKSRQLNSNVGFNSWTCRLPYEFPVVSNTGNDIGIHRNLKDSTVTVTFFVYRNFFEAPSTHIIYSNDSLEIQKLERQVLHDNEHNWKIRDNWYRTFGQ